MQIAMLGPLDVRTDDGSPCAIAGARLSRLMIVLALQPGTVVSAPAIVDAVWGDVPPDEPANAVQALISRLRRAVPGIMITSRAGGYVLDVPADAVDVVVFQRRVAQGRRLAGTDPARAAAELAGALDLWRGEALADAGTADFATPVRAKLDEVRLTALAARIELDIEIGPAVPLVAELEELVNAYPLREPLAVLLMRALTASGDRGRALAAFDAARTRLRDELGITPSAALAAEHLRILRGDLEIAEPGTIRGSRAGGTGAGGTGAGGTGAGGTGSNQQSAGDQHSDDSPRGDDNHRSAAPAEPRLTNLRAELSSFVGRDADVAAVDALLTEHRLTTLIGPGGAGKTRLAAYAGRAFADITPGGVWMVEFAPVTDPDDVATTVLATLGIRDRALVRTTGASLMIPPGEEPIERLIAALARRTIVIIFDNCEHLIQATAQVADALLGSCPGVRILATSREPLGVSGEVLWPVEPLALPPEEIGMAVTELITYPSIRLFIQRARAARPGFTVTEANAGAVVTICRALDGMPLAIELAAARLRAMTAEQIADRLGDRFAIITGGSRVALPRHQTLRAVVDWSWDLLDDGERVLWRRLAIFTGGATLEAAEAICADRDLPVLDLISALVEKSLLSIRDDGPEPRYWMLETIRAYGLVRLDEAGERPATRAAHARYFRDLAFSARDGLVGRNQLEWLARLAADDDNINTAVRNAVADGDADTAARLAGSVGWYWRIAGHRHEGTDLALLVLNLLRADPVERDPDLDLDDPATREMLETRGLAYAIGALVAVESETNLAEAMDWFERATAIVNRLGWPQTPILRMVAPLNRVFHTFESGILQPGLGLDMPVDDPDPWVAGMARVMRAHMMLNFGRQHAAAEADFRDALDVFRGLGERWGSSFAQMSLASLEAWRGEIPEAIADIDEAMRSVVELGIWEDRVNFRSQLARLLWLAGDRTRAYAELANAERDAVRIGLQVTQAVVAHAGADIARFDGDPVKAFALVRKAEALMVDQHLQVQFRAMLISCRAYIEAARGDLDEARRLHREAVAAAVSSIDAPVIAQTLVGLADVALAEGDFPAAATILGASTAIRGTPDLSLVDGLRVAGAASDALGQAAFDAAYHRGFSATTAQIGELVGIAMPEITAADVFGNALEDMHALEAPVD